MIKKNEPPQRPERQRIKPPEIQRRPADSAGTLKFSPRRENKPSPFAPRKFDGQAERMERRVGKPLRSASSDRKFGTRSMSSSRTPSQRPLPHTAHEIEKSNGDALRYVPLGGLEEIGRNCVFFEYKNEIIIIDAGLQFPEEETPGIDYIIPNVAYLEKKKANIQGIILTHGHYDHIGALPHILEKLGNPPIYTTAMTKAIIEKRRDDFPNSPKMNIQVVKNHDEIKLSNHFTGVFFAVPHTIPDSTGVLLKTPIGNIVHLGDFRVDYNEAGEAQGLDEFERIGKMGIHTFLAESTNAEKPGHSVSEKTVEKNLEAIFKTAKGRIVVATFSSLLTRIAEVIKISERLGRKVAFSGYSMKANVQIAQTLGFIKAKEGTIVPLEEVGKLRDDKVMILSTGAQGESNASLMKIINGEHRNLKVKPGDTFILSASVIPGNERSVQYLKDNLARQGAIVHQSTLVDLHASGHALKEDIQLITKLIHPRFFVPIHGYYFMRAANSIAAQEIGVPKENTFLMDNGQVAELTKSTFKVTKETVPAFYVMVDGLGVGDVEEVVLRDRRALAEEGMLVIIMTLDRDKGKLLKNPDIISRGFIYLKENQEMLEEIRKRIRTLLARLPNREKPEPDYLKTLIRDQIGQFLFNKTRRRPMILPVIIEI